MTDIQKVLQAYNPENFRTQGYELLNILAEYLHQVTSGEGYKVLPNINPCELTNKLDDSFLQEPQEKLFALIDAFIQESQHVHHPGFIGHQFAPVIPQATLIELVVGVIHNSAAVFEMGPLATCMEQKVARWAADQIGYSQESGGFLTSGGTVGNLTALLAARQSKAGYDIWQEGYDSTKPLAVMVSGLVHYSVSRACKIMGLGEEALYPIPCNHSYAASIDQLERVYQEAIQNGRQVFALVANAGSTPTGSIDDLASLAYFCQKYNIWLHVDGAHGAPLLLAHKYKYLLKGIDQADSVVWDFHKMMLMTCVTTAVIFKDKKYAYENFSQKASYLLDQDSYEEWYNLAHQTFECTKPSMGFKVYTHLVTLGTEFFDIYLTHMIDLTKQFARLINQSPSFELAVEPHCNIICFRFVKEDVKDLDQLQVRIKKEILSEGSFYITQTRLDKGLFLRCTLINPFTTFQHLESLLKRLEELGSVHYPL